MSKNKKVLTSPKGIQLVPIGSLKANPTNPRVLRDEKFIKLKNSIQSFPDMLNYRSVVAVTDTDGKLMVLGGNMRLRAMQDLGIKEVPVMIADHWTEEQRREFIIKDNVGFGEWDWDGLANEWDARCWDLWKAPNGTASSNSTAWPSPIGSRAIAKAGQSATPSGGCANNTRTSNGA
jgi:hypothetical protein